MTARLNRRDLLKSAAGLAAAATLGAFADREANAAAPQVAQTPQPKPTLRHPQYASIDQCLQRAVDNFGSVVTRKRIRDWAGG